MSKVDHLGLPVDRSFDGPHPKTPPWPPKGPATTKKTIFFNFLKVFSQSPALLRAKEPFWGLGPYEESCPARSSRRSVF